MKLLQFSGWERLLPILLTLKSYLITSDNPSNYGSLWGLPFFKIYFYHSSDWRLRFKRFTGKTAPTKTIAFAFFVLFSRDIDAQISMIDSFYQSRWKSQYSGDTNLFIRANSQLTSNSNNPLKHTYKLEFHVSPINEIELNCNALCNINLSSSNYIEIGLLDSNGKRTFIRIGNTQDQSQMFVGDSMVLIGPEKEFDLSKFVYNFKITHSKGQFQFQLRNELTQLTKKFDYNSSTNQFHWTGGYIKILQYGSSAIGKHSFQNLYIGPIRKDTFPPKVIDCKQRDNYNIEIKFNEKLQNISNNNLKLSPFDIEKYTMSIDSNGVLIQLNNPFRKSCDSLKIILNDVSDIESNVLKFHSIILNYLYIDTPNFGDIILTEFMTKPSPSLGLLPEKKYLEILNNSKKIFNLSGLYLSDQVAQCRLPQYILHPKEILLLVSINDTQNFKNYHFLGIPSFPSFNQDEDYIILKSANNKIIFQVYYTENMHHWQYRNGGYSLEKTDINHGTFELNNWFSNQQNGGTPGTILTNASTIPQNIKVIESYFTSDSIYLRMNQTLDPNLVYKLKTTTHLLDVRIKNTDIMVGKLPLVLKDFKKIELLELLEGDSILNKNQESILSYKENFDGTKLDFNEIMYHNFVGNPDFLELTNNDSLAIFMNQFVLTIKEENGIAIKEQIPLKNKERWLIYPGEILAFSTDKTRIFEQFPDGNIQKIIHLKGLPNFNSEQGFLELTHLTQWTKTVSTVQYNNSLHNPIHTETTGISLEKYNDNLRSDLPSSWGSATGLKHYGTPGDQNSIFFSGGTLTQNKFQLRNQRITISPTSVEPLIIDFTFSQPGYIMNASIFRKDGSLIEHSIQNIRIGVNGSIAIKPIYKDSPLPTENYVLKLEAFLPNADICKQIIRFSIINPTSN